MNEDKFPIRSYNTIIIGSGTAALNAAVCLSNHGQNDIAIITEEWGGGTSNNAGSDKQTYYKMSASGDKKDSPYNMAKDLFNGGSMHGDIALCEAQHSLQAFYKLVDLGVPFPHDKYGSFVGYVTDHDSVGRASSAGPLTSQMMFGSLSKEVHKRRIKVYKDCSVISLLTKECNDGRHITGAVAIEKGKKNLKGTGIILFNALNVIIATGGPAAMYLNSAYPLSQTGSSGMAFRIGAVGQNLTESQFGIASVKFRWNLSGSYQQVIPRYYSADKDGKNKREFLSEYFPDNKSLLSAIFLKGYQWPFDSRKLNDYGSSLIDFLVYHETFVKKRKVFIDYSKNPEGINSNNIISPTMVSDEAYTYLSNSNALFGTPFQRLQILNPSAIDLYLKNGIDLENEALEIAVCAQHNNGGLRGNIWWESNIKHLFPIGELNGSHGVYRPGGSALNAGQVGGIRAAMFISSNYNEQPSDEETFIKNCKEQVQEIINFSKKIINKNSNIKNLNEFSSRIKCLMSEHGSFIRDKNLIKDAVKNARNIFDQINTKLEIPNLQKLPDAFKLIDHAITHIVYLEAIADYIKKAGCSRGSYLVLDEKGKRILENIDDGYKYLPYIPNTFVNKYIQEISIDKNLEITSNWIKPRPVPHDNNWFETIWEKFKNRDIIK